MSSCRTTGGFIFPLFMAGASLGRGLAQIRGIPFISDVPPVLLAMSIATGAGSETGLLRSAPRM